MWRETLLHIPHDVIAPPDDALYRAATYLGTTIHACEPEKRKRHPVIEAIKRTFPQWVVEKTASVDYAAWELHSYLLQWIQLTFFRLHRSVPVPPAIACHGVALPGHDTPAAGWLLPQTTPVISIPNGATNGVSTYRHPLVKLPPGVMLNQRRHPWPIASLEYGIFIESAYKEDLTVEYLVLAAN